MNNPIKILHLEDLHSDAVLIGNALKKEKLNFEVLVVDSKDKFIKALTEYAPDIILADHSLPSFNSFEALELMEEMGVKIPFILITAAMSDEFAVNIIQKGANDYILKDRLKRLPNAIKSCLEKFTLEKERQKYITELTANERRYRALIENSADAIIILNIAGKPTYVSSTIQRILGYSEAEALALELHHIVHPDDKESFAAIIVECLLKPETPSAPFICRFQHQDGNWVWIETTFTNMLEKPGINGLVANSRDITERKLAEEQLRESELFNKSVLASLASHIAVIDTKGDIIAVNKAWNDYSRKNGVDALERTSIGSNYFSVCEKAIACGDTIAEQALAGVYSVFKNEKPIFELEYPCHAPDQQQWYNMHVMRFGDDLSKVVISHQNVTDRKVAENKILVTSSALEQALNELQKIMDSSLDVICTTDANGRFVTVSSASERIWGYKPSELEGTSTLHLVYDDDIENTRKVAKQIYSGVPVTIFENRFKHKNGSVVPLLWSARWDEKDKLMYCIAKDATEKKRLEKAFESERERFHELFLHAPCSVGIFKGPDHIFEMANDHYLKLTGRKNIIGKTIREVFPEAEDQGIYELLNQVYKTGISYSANEHLLKVYKDGAGNLQHIYLNSAYQAYRNKENVIEGVFFFAIDVTEQVQARKRIEKSEKQYRQIVETAQEGIWLLDKDNKTIFVNSKLCQILEYSREELMGQAIASFMDEEGKKLTEQLRIKKGNGINGQVELKYISKSKKEIWASVALNQIFDETDQYQGALAMVADITEKKELEKLLAKASQLARIGSYELNLKNNTLYWSDVTKEIHEVPANFKPAVKAAINFFKFGVSRFTIQKAFKEAIENNIPFDLELQLITTRGNERWVRVIGEPVIEDGQCTQIYGSFQDIDKVKRAELEVLSVYEERNTILESIGDAFFALDKNWTVTYWNKEAEKLLVHPKSKILNKSLWDVLPVGRDSEFFRKFNQAITSNQIIHFEEYYLPTDKWYEISAYPSSSGLSVYFKDTTERKLSAIRLQELNENLQKYTNQLVISNKELEQFSYIVSHNLRAPVANIIGLAGLMTQQTYLPTEKEEFLKSLLLSVKRLDEVVLDLNKILRVKKEISEKKETVNLDNLVYNIQVSIQHLIQREEVYIETDFSAINEISTLKSYLHSILYNLISNSIKYRQPDLPALIKIKTEILEEDLLIIFQDNGTGIDLQKRKDQVFGLYKRFHQHIEGKGIGLFMVKTQVETLGGKISIYSEINKGTEFKIQLPINK